MYMSNLLYKCPECESEARWRGLCRECTEYDDNNKVVNPVQRVRQNANVQNGLRQMPTIESFRQQRMRKPTKKQIAAIIEAQNRHHSEHSCEDENCTHNHNEYDFVEIGGEEE